MNSSDDSNIKTILDNLDQRTRELDCIYKVEEVLRDFESSLEDVFHSLVEIIPGGWRHKEICKVRISYGELDISTEGYKKTELSIISSLNIEGKKAGEIQVCYVKPIREEKGIFLSEENTLLNTIAQKTSNFILYKKLRQSINELTENKEYKISEVESTDEKLFKWLKEKHLQKHEIEKIMQFPLKFKKGETICKQGAITSFIMILSEGLTKNYLEGSLERGFNFSIIKPFDFIGLSSLYGNNNYHFSGSAILPCTVYMVDIEFFRQLISTNTAFSAEIMKWYCRITEGHLNRLSCLANKQALGRIADILIYLSDRIFNGKMIESTISRKDIAELAGMSTESAVRILSDLKKDKIIKILDKGIEINDLKLLRTLSLAG